MTKRQEYMIWLAATQSFDEREDWRDLLDIWLDEQNNGK